MWHTPPLFLAVAVAALLSRRASGLAGFYLVGFLAVVLALGWVYWTSQQPDIAGHISRTALRTVTAPLFLAAGALAHLLPQLVQAPAVAGPDALTGPPEAPARPVERPQTAASA